ncbi:hypothetical protein [Komagataeibacter intermedius]|uniref:Uncharacterized protein n=1 Tax=Komagataeibacter intermedius NRIC 0521 TaxID=1307934 RepID=A0ABQ0PGP3_9PROT|nr:hypothetical protein [Komagataeibacter intermedius]GAN86385.1 hypothetical protein Gain_0027_060 [Komagataeibacter intermedius TF2]GBQ68062.1 hypothetical protein AA0521_1143 [Komagataeibacter intermedius NRIC 0521]
MCSNLPDGCSQGDIDNALGGYWPAWAEDEYQRLCEYRSSLIALREQAKGVDARFHDVSDMTGGLHGGALDDEIVMVNKSIKDFPETVERIEADGRESRSFDCADMRRAERMECAA